MAIVGFRDNVLSLQVKEQLKDVFGIAITTDGWTSVATKGYYTVTAHWLDPDFVMHRLVLGVERLTGSHTSEVIAQLLNSVFERFEITDKVFHSTTDNAEPLVKAIRDLNLLHSRCFAHSLQLIVKKALESNSALIGKVRSLVGSFHHSSVKTEALESTQKVLHKDVVKLVQDTPTRWQATYLMLQSVTRCEDALLLIQPATVDADKRLSAAEFDSIRQLAFGLEPYHTVTTALEGDSYPTLNELLPQWFGLVADAEDLRGNAVRAWQAVRFVVGGNGQARRQDRVSGRNYCVHARPPLPPAASLRGGQGRRRQRWQR